MNRDAKKQDTACQTRQGDDCRRDREIRVVAGRANAAIADSTQERQCHGNGSQDPQHSCREAVHAAGHGCRQRSMGVVGGNRNCRDEKRKNENREQGKINDFDHSIEIRMRRVIAHAQNIPGIFAAGKEMEDGVSRALRYQKKGDRKKREQAGFAPEAKMDEKNGGHEQGNERIDSHAEQRVHVHSPEL